MWALIKQADSRLLEAELVRTLRAKLSPLAPTPRERRHGDLHLLHDLIVSTKQPFPQRLAYDRARDNTDDLTSRTILHRYGSWWEACSIAARMETDGKLPRGRTFSGGRTRDRAKPPPYTAEEGIGAVRLCAFSIGRRPSSRWYDEWSSTQQRIARERHVDKRIPSRGALARLFPGQRRWERILGAAAITDAELQVARAAFLFRSRDSDENPFLHLPLSQASTVAVELKGSLDWLGGRTSERTPIPDMPATFDHERFRHLRDQSSVPPSRMVEAAGLTVGQARRLLTGSYEPTLGQLIDVASLLGVAAGDLCDLRSSAEDSDRHQY